tara:strand:+ start:2275 stop:2667 length:393 start_codon:yes stop_codon:yes gene_type:complete
MMALKKKKNKVAVSVTATNDGNKEVLHKNVSTADIPLPPLERLNELLTIKQQGGNLFYPETTVNLNTDLSYKEFGNGFSISLSVTLTVPQCNEGIVLGFETARQILFHEGKTATIMAKELYESQITPKDK